MTEIPLLHFENVTKLYQSNGLVVKALDRVTLTVAKGEFVVAAGPSGSGKSTLLHMVGALDRPSEGKVIVEGLDLARQDQKTLAAFRLTKIGFVFQAYNLIPVLTAQENVEYPLLLQKVSQKEREERAHYFLKRVGLGDQSQKRPGEMSGGQQQRVAVARALASKPGIILADEPTANLDSKSGSALIDLFKELNEQYQATFLFASHDPMVIEKARRVIHLHDGRIS